MPSGAKVIESRFMFNRREAQMSEVTQAATGAVPKPRTRPNQPLHAAQVADALLRLSTVVAITGLSRSSLYARIKAGSFVEPIRLGARCTRFRAGDVTAWIAAQVAAAK